MKSWSSRRIAEWCAEHHQLVESVRKENPSSEDSGRVGTDGKIYPRDQVGESSTCNYASEPDENEIESYIDLDMDECLKAVTT
jgi:hypothetical protein